MEMIEIESSNLKAIGYDEDKCICHIQFHNGGTYKYYPFQKKLWLAFQKAESKGGFFAQYIKNNGLIKFEKIKETKSKKK